MWTDGDWFDLQLAIAKNNIIKLQEENHQLRNENTIILMKTQQHLEVLYLLDVPLISPTTQPDAHTLLCVVLCDWPGDAGGCGCGERHV